MTEKAGDEITQKTYLDTLSISQGDKATLIAYLNRIVSNKLEKCNDTVLVIHGESCSGKTTMIRVLRQLFSDHWIPFKTFGQDEYEKIESTKVRVVFIDQSEGVACGVIKELASGVFVIMIRDEKIDNYLNEGVKRRLHQVELGRLNSEYQQSVFQLYEIKRMADELLTEIQ